MNIQIGDVVQIVAMSDACSRTKSCIVEYGNDGFEIVSFNPYSQRFGNTPALLVRAVTGSSSRHDKWLGWLPLLEIGDKNDSRKD